MTRSTEIVLRPTAVYPLGEPYNDGGQIVRDFVFEIGAQRYRVVWPETMLKIDMREKK